MTHPHTLTFRFPYNPSTVARLKSLEVGARWDPIQRCWTIPTYAAPIVKQTFPTWPLKLPVLPAGEESPVGTSAHITYTRLIKAYQQEGIQFLLRHHRAALLDEMGLGKTLQTLWALWTACRWPALIVCPAYLKLNWKREIERWLPFPSGASVNILEHQSKTLRPLPAAFNITNYEILDTEYATPPQVIVFDEAHYLKEGRSQRTAKALHLVDRYPDAWVYLLTGTLAVNRPKELWAPLRLIDPRCPPRFWDFARLFCAPVKNEEFDFWDLSGAAHLDVLHKIVESVSLRRTQKEVSGQLDPVQFNQLSVPLLKSERKQYNAVLKSLTTYLLAHSGQHVQPSKIKEFHVLRDITFGAKLRAFLEWFKESEVTSCLTFCEYREHVERTAAALNGAHGESKGMPLTNVTSFHGEVSPAARTARIRVFQATPQRPRALVCTTASGGTGFHLKDVQHVAFLDIPWTPKDLQQAASRPWDVEQQSHVSAAVFMGADTVDDDVYRAIERKEQIVGEIMGERVQADVLLSLLKRLQKR